MTPTPTLTPTPMATFVPTSTPPGGGEPEEPNACVFKWVDWDGGVSSQSELAQNMEDVRRSGTWRLNQVIPRGPEVVYSSAVAAQLQARVNAGDVLKIPLTYENGDGNYVICGFSNVRLIHADLNAGEMTIEILRTLIHGVETDPGATDTGVGRDVRLIQ